MGGGLLVVALLGACRKPPPPPPPPAPLRVLEARRLAELGTPVRSGAFHPTGLVAGGTEAGSVLLARAGQLRVLGEPRVHQGPVTGLQFSSDGKHLLSAGGQLAIWWGTDGGAALGKVRGPQPISCALLRESSGHAVAYLGTALGAMVRWPVDEKRAQPMRELACPALPVPVGRRELPEAQRCPYGSFVEAEDGSGAACVYPVTALALGGNKLWRACREGSLYGEDLDARVRQGFGVGHLRSIAVRSDGVLLLARDEGELRLFDADRHEVKGELEPAGVAQLAASAAELLAVAQGDRVRLFVGLSRRPSAEVTLGRRVVALDLRSSPAELRLLTEDGRAEARALQR